MTPRPLRFTKSHPCPICGGHDGLARGQGIRCFGYRSGDYAHCTRAEHAGNLRQNRDGTYSHRLENGPCHCGLAHGEAQTPAGNGRSAARMLRRRAEQRFRSFHTLRAFLRRYGDGTDIRHWIYRDATGDEVFRVLRIDYAAPGGMPAKSYRPCHRAADGKWLLSRPDGKLPLFNLPDVLSAPPEAVITVLEGEKCACLAIALGLAFATTSAHGAKAPWLSDWSPLVGRRVAILRDADIDGEGYAAKVASLLGELDPPAHVQIVSLPGLAEGEDIEQFIAARRTAGRTDAEILAELEALIDTAR